MNFDDTFQSPFERERPYSVSEINYGITEILQKENLFVCVEGEVSGFKKAYSGHSYFTLKDNFSKIPAVIWKDKTDIAALSDGMQIIVLAEIKVYQTGGYYQLDVMKAFAAGIGENFVKLEELKQKLANEGLFAPEKKRALPKNINKIGVVTAKNGAAFQDILKITGEYAPNIDVVLAPTSVQGNIAAKTLIEAIENLNNYGDTTENLPVDIIIFGRGGGSAEDLSVFNDESVVRAVANSKIPIISAIGHEIDKSLCDFAADIYAPTPTAAAEIVSRASYELRNSFENLRFAFEKAARRKLLAVQNFEQVLDNLSNDLRTNFLRIYSKKEQQINNYERILNALNPNLPLIKGFALLRKDGKIVRNTDKLKIGDNLKIQLSDNSFGVQVNEL